MLLTKLYNEFFRSEKTGGLILVFTTVVSLFLANSAWSQGYLHFWHIDIAGHSLVHWINDGLMTIFFLLIGLELEREMYEGELSKIKNALLPIIAAIGGMLVPAGIYMALNDGTPTQAGSGIPMATDIAFAIGILSILGSKVPGSLKIFLTALAVFDDLGAIVVIALFYTAEISWINLLLALAVFFLMLILNRRKVCNMYPYLIGGAVMWYFMLHSGVHATITGVLLAFAIPFGTSKERSPSYKLQHALHKPVAFFILPVFALANTAIVIRSGWQTNLLEVGSLGIILGLLVGKPLGITLFSYLATRFKVAALPKDLRWSYVLGAGFLGGIGFTMSIFITLLAFSNSEDFANNAKMAILIGSLLSGIAGLLWLKLKLRTDVVDTEE
ncbi:MAG: Na+/H+ antiporter NhaA [Paludibacter sp.]|nr:Na+/H+ antiporter NhaA [Paludibacter sp.]